MTTAVGLGLAMLGVLLVWGAVSNRDPIALVTAGFTGGEFTDADPIQ